MFASYRKTSKLAFLTIILITICRAHGAARTGRILPPDPPDAGNRINKYKATISKSGFSYISNRILSFTTEALRKAEAMEKTLMP